MVFGSGSRGNHNCSAWTWLQIRKLNKVNKKFPFTPGLIGAIIWRLAAALKPVLVVCCKKTKVAGAGWSRGFWLEPEPKISPGSGSYSTVPVLKIFCFYGT